MLLIGLSLLNFVHKNYLIKEIWYNCKCQLKNVELGMQYVIRTKKALDQISFNHLFYISQIEKQTLISERLDLNNICQDKVKVARISFRGKGQYIDELLK